MRKIFPLPEHVVAQISAGEVIERPVYAVKELVENALDAHASSIIIRLEKSGLQHIAVIDDGEGMSKEDLLESFKPHTTSKIKGDNLASIKTLGFRGEALSSIASISNMSIASRPKDQTAGFRVNLHADEIEDIVPFGMPEGTIVNVSNLFYSVPARKKFLKSDQTEYRHIIDLVSSIALSHPTVSFELFHNNREVLRLSSVSTTLERIQQLTGYHISSQLIPLDYSDSYLKIHGFVTRPQVHTRTLSKTHIFVNKRKISDRQIALSIKETYDNLLENDVFPIFYLFIDIPAEAVDVNIHPRKEHISFVDSRFVLEAVIHAVRKTLSDHNLTFSNLSFEVAGGTKTYAAHILKEKIQHYDISQIGKIVKEDEVFQIHNLYILTTTQNRLLLIDQHAAHERILYEVYKKEFQLQKNARKQFPLYKTLHLSLSLSDSEVLSEYLVEFEKLGFIIKKNTTTDWEVHAVPELFKDRNLQEFIHELLDRLAHEKKIDIDSLSSTMLAYLSCRSAVMAGQQLSIDDMTKLIREINNTSNKYTCPHGRPTMIEVSLQEVNKMFKR